ncbi:hypothetical protein ACGF1Z_07970 [Streptomyces sp. NPDC048018]|uniref:hypothetical protein n=1 Tax=Streptomyces sp. NPDC048018 TaxID=3365499 RepID=UPI003717AB8C
MTHTRSPLRALRAALFAAVCVVLAAVGHSSMSAHAIPPGSLLAAFGVVAALAWSAAARRRGPAALATGLTAVQGVLHLLFGLGENPGPAGTTAGAAGTAGMQGMPGMTGAAHTGAAELAADGAGALAGTAAELPAAVLADPFLTHAAHLTHAGPLTQGHAMGAGSGAGMLAAHLLAALVCGLWLARGEAALFALARTVGASTFSPLRLALAVVRVPVPVAPSLRPVRVSPYTRRLHGVVLAHTVSRRGPPDRPAPRATALGARV